MDLDYLRSKIKEITDNSESEEVQLLGMLLSVKSEFDEAHFKNLMSVLNDHRKLIDELERKSKTASKKDKEHDEKIMGLQSQIAFERARRLQLHPEEKENGNGNGS